MRIYFAAPLFSQAEREFNAQVAKVLRENGFDVFLPQEYSGDIEIPDNEEKRRRLLTQQRVRSLPKLQRRSRLQLKQAALILTVTPDLKM